MEAARRFISVAWKRSHKVWSSIARRLEAARRLYRKLIAVAMLDVFVERQLVYTPAPSNLPCAQSELVFGCPKRTRIMLSRAHELHEPSQMQLSGRTSSDPACVIASKALIIPKGKVWVLSYHRSSSGSPKMVSSSLDRRKIPAITHTRLCG